MAWTGLVNEFDRYLPVSANTPGMTLLEAVTPFISSRIPEGGQGYRGKAHQCGLERTAW